VLADQPDRLGLRARVIPARHRAILLPKEGGVHETRVSSDSSELLSTTGSTPAGFWAHVWAVIEAILWPAFVVYHLLAHIAT
jgi:hypothetical protein